MNTKTKTTAVATTAIETKVRKTRTTDSEWRNGIRRPNYGIVVGSMWATFDAGKLVDGKTKIEVSNIAELAESMGWHVGLTKSHYRQWKKFYATPAEQITVEKKTVKAVKTVAKTPKKLPEVSNAGASVGL